MSLGDGQVEGRALIRPTRPPPLSVPRWWGQGTPKGQLVKLCSAMFAVSFSVATFSLPEMSTVRVGVNVIFLFGSCYFHLYNVDWI